MSDQSWSQTIDFTQAQSILLEENFKLKVLQKQALQYKSRISQDSSLPDPKVKLGLNNVPVIKPSFNESDMTGKEIGIYQMFPFFGKLSAKERIAILEYKKALEMYRLYQAYYLHAVRSHFFEIAYLKEYLKIIEETKKYLTILLEIQKSRSSAGIGMVSDVLKISVELSKLDEEIIKVNTAIVEIENNIAYLLGDSSEKKNYIADFKYDTITIQNQPNSAVSEKILSENPELQLLSLQIQMDKEGVNLKQKDLYPDVEIGVAYMQRDSTPQGATRDDMFSVMATFNIPAWFTSKNIPAIQEMNIKIGQSEAELNDKKNEIIFALSTISINTEKWKQLYELYSRHVIPHLETMLQTDIAYYRTGTTEFMKLMDTIRMLLNYKQEQLNTIKEYCKSVSFLHFLQGDTSILDWSGVQ
ncbi:MAG: TolC family protein [Spirochaetota bacterium]